MKVLKPEVEEIAKRYPKSEDAMKKQSATMALYKSAGANPMSGCLPMLLQLPILLALFRFFPASIELRQQSFLWATDLSTYDSIYDFGFKVPFYGDHISLFTILMTIATLVYTKINNDMMASTNAQQAKTMKIMMYMMPIMFLGIFNNYAAGLSYYYFLVNVITFLQMWLFRVFIDEKKIHEKIQLNKLKPVKKSGWSQKLENLAKQQQQVKQANNQKKR
jgi:YidC/Oxa1 family membrane protein insertase